MPLLEWHPGMSVHIDIIDEEHKKWIEFLNNLYDAIQGHGAPDVLSMTFLKIMAYTNYHFQHEEELFAPTDYPNQKEHILEHRKMQEQLSTIHSKLRMGATDELTIELMVFIKEWLINHIQGTDMGYVSFVKAKNEGRG